MLPYTTEANVIKIVNEKLKESGEVPSKDEIISIVNDAIESGELVDYVEVDLSNYLTIQEQTVLLTPLIQTLQDTTGKDFVELQVFNTKLDLADIKADVIKLKVTTDIFNEGLGTDESIIYLRRTTNKFLGRTLISFIASGYWIQSGGTGASFSIGVSNSNDNSEITVIARKLNV